MREASYYTAGDSGRVECTLCPHNCKIAPGKRGICGVRENQDGKLVSLVYGKLAASHIDPIEKKPLFHFLPGSSAYSVATVGCNLSCPFCQNHDLSLACRDKSRIGGLDAQVEQIVAEALSSGCESLCFTYTEPTIFFEYMLDLAVLGKEKGLKNTMVSNGFIQPEPLKELSPYMDAANIDLKAFREKTYREILKARLQPVLDTISTLPSLGVWTEVTRHVLACSSGSAAIHAAVKACGVGPGDEVVTTPITDAGTILGAVYEGAIPVFADIDPTGYNATAATIFF